MERLSDHIIRCYTEILKEELLPAMGCTEPIAIAYAASILRHAIGCDPERICVGLSGNIIKNVKSVIVPATGGLHGISAAVAAGIVAACPEKQLEVLCTLDEKDQEKISDLLNSVPVEIRELNTYNAFEIDLTGIREETNVRVHFVGRHTNVAYVEKNGKDITKSYQKKGCSPDSDATQTDRSLLNVKDIVTFAEQADLEELNPYLRRQIDMNLAIAEEGLKNDYGACIGKLLYANGQCDLRNRAKAYAAAGSDARMSGCELPVCILSGSGNQGMTASLPVIIYAKERNADEELLLRSLIVSDLITIRQKTGIGCLSAYCGAISAGCGSGCGICYLEGGRFYEIAHTLVNTVAILSGTICDGAKASCAAKIAMAVEAGLMGYEMMKSGHQFYGGDGIITKGVENTIENIGRLARDGMEETDKEIIRIMLSDTTKA
ncbi:MAG: serine dehydratase subunit alpha family protein [Clostridia bacterium]|nr:serine dehydratase subunit alpha family protein [Clostridia bacterium]